MIFAASVATFEGERGGDGASASPARGRRAMPGLVESSYALFAIVWGLMCLMSGALVTDALLRDSRAADDTRLGG